MQTIIRDNDISVLPSQIIPLKSASKEGKNMAMKILRFSVNIPWLSKRKGKAQFI